MALLETTENEDIKTTRGQTDNVKDIQNDESFKTQLEMKKILKELKKAVDIKINDKNTQQLLEEGKLLDKQNMTGVNTLSNENFLKKYQALQSVDPTLASPETIKKSIDNKIAQLANKTLNTRVEEAFDKWIIAQRTVSGNKENFNTQKNQIKANFNAYLRANPDIYIPLVAELKTVLGEEDAEVSAELTKYQFELHDLNVNIIGSSPSIGYDYRVSKPLDGDVSKTSQIETTTGNTSGGTDKQKQAALETFELRGTHLDIFETSGTYYEAKKAFIEKGEDSKESLDIFDITNDKRIPKALLLLLQNDADDDGKGDLSKRQFNINISKQDGFARIISEIETKYDGNPEKVLEKYNEQRAEKGKSESTELTGKVIRTMFPRYNHQGGIDNEGRKISKILTQAKWEDLSTFSHLVEEGNASKLVKSQANAKQLLEAKYEGQDIVSTDNLWDFVCDYDSNGRVEQTDRGTVFGLQVKFHLQQAINFAGEEAVIKEVCKAINIAGTKYETADFATITTKQDLLTLFKDYPDTVVLFRTAIERINGGNQEINPDLTNLLRGKSALELSEKTLESHKLQLKNTISNYISKNPQFANWIAKEGLVHVRENIFSKLMHVADYVGTIQARGGKELNPGATFQNDPGVDLKLKQWATDQALSNITQSFVRGLVHWDWSKGNFATLTLGTGYGKTENTRSADQAANSQGGDLITSRNAGIAPGYNFLAKGFCLDIPFGGSIEKQFNYKKVINSSLDDIRSAKYLGAEGRVDVNLFNKYFGGGVGIETSAGVKFDRDIVMGINQLDRQYDDVSRQIFDISTLSDTKLYDKNAFLSHFKTNQDIAKTNGYGDFITNNTEFLKTNGQFIVDFLEANGFFDPALTPLKGKTDGEKKIAVNDLVSILQGGNISAWRHDVIAPLQNKFELTGLSFGIINKPLVLGRKKIGSAEVKTMDVDTEIANIANKDNVSNWTAIEADVRAGKQVVVTGNPEMQTKLNEIATNIYNKEYNKEVGAANKAQSAEDLRIGILGAYVSARVSNWTTNYLPQEEQMAFTQNALSKGLFLENTDAEVPTGDLNKTAEYLKNIFNTNLLSIELAPQTASPALTGKIVFTYHGDSKKNPNQPATLAEFLNIYATKDAKKQLNLSENTLEIGNVGLLNASTMTEGKGVRRFLMLGAKEMSKGERIIKTQQTPTITDIPEGAKDYTTWTESSLTAVFPTYSQEIQRDFVSKIKPLLDAATTPTGTLILNKLPNTQVSYDFVENTTSSVLILQVNDYTTATSQREKAQEKTKNFFDYRSETSAAYGTMKDTYETFFKRNLANVDMLNSDAYKDFLTNLIIDKNINGAIDAMKSLNNSDTGLQILNTLLDDQNITDGHKAYIVSQSLAYMAYQPLGYAYSAEVDANGNHLEQKLSNITHLKDIYSKSSKPWEHMGSWTKIAGPSNIPLENTGLLKTMYQIKKGFIESHPKNYLSYESSYKRHPQADLIGYTSFYRQNNAQGYHLTPIGKTNIFDGKIYNFSDQNEQKTAKEWVGNNLKAEAQYNKTYFFDVFGPALKTSGLTPTEISDHAVQDKIFDALISGQATEIDINGFKKRITIQANPVFYFMGECVNESLGVQIKKIRIEDQKPDTTTGYGETEYTQKPGVSTHISSHTVANEVVAQTRGLQTIGNYITGAIKDINKPLYNQPAGTAGEYIVKSDPGIDPNKPNNNPVNNPNDGV